MDKYRVGYQPEKNWHAKRYVCYSGESELVANAVLFNKEEADAVATVLRDRTDFVWEAMPVIPVDPIVWQEKYDTLMDNLTAYFRLHQEGKLPQGVAKMVAHATPKGVEFKDYTLEQLIQLDKIIRPLVERTY